MVHQYPSHTYNKFYSKLNCGNNKTIKTGFCGSFPPGIFFMGDECEKRLPPCIINETYILCKQHNQPISTKNSRNSRIDECSLSEFVPAVINQLISHQTPVTQERLRAAFQNYVHLLCSCNRTKLKNKK